MVISCSLGSLQFIVLAKRLRGLIINVFFIPCIQVVLAHIATNLAQAPKSIAVYSAYKRAKSLVKECMGGQPGVPLHLRNAPTKLDTAIEPFFVECVSWIFNREQCKKIGLSKDFKDFNCGTEIYLKFI